MGDKGFVFTPSSSRQKVTIVHHELQRLPLFDLFCFVLFGGHTQWCLGPTPGRDPSGRLGIESGPAACKTNLCYHCSPLQRLLFFKYNLYLSTVITFVILRIFLKHEPIGIMNLSYFGCFHVTHLQLNSNHPLPCFLSLPIE